LKDLDPEQGLPFEDAPAPDLFVLILRQLWGQYWGLVLSPVSDETQNCGGVKMETGGMGEDSVEVNGNWDVEEILDEVVDRAPELIKMKAPTAGANPFTQSPSIMVADTGLETPGTGLGRAKTV
jgi:hypothetical protein